MRESTSPILKNLACELESQKEKLIQFRFEEGDSSAFDAPSNKYRLSKTDQLDLTDRLSGEQNRMLYGQVRPSYFGDKKDTPLLDSEVEVNTKKDTNNSSSFSYSKSQQKNFTTKTGGKWESTLRAIHGVGEITRSEEVEEVKAKYAQELFDYVDGIKFSKASVLYAGNLRRTFEQYSLLGSSSNPKHMDTTQFQSLLKKNDLYFKGFGPKNADVMFFQGNSKRFITFE